MVGNAHILPDSRLQNETLGSVMMDWPLPGGGVVRIEAVRVYCGSCSKEFGLVPRDNTAFTFWLCSQCFAKYGAIANTYAMPDDEFNQNLAAEMESRFGHHLTPDGIRAAVEGHDLGPALEALMRDSPFLGADH